MKISSSTLHDTRGLKSSRVTVRCKKAAYDFRPTTGERLIMKDWSDRLQPVEIYFVNGKISCITKQLLESLTRSLCEIVKEWER